MQSSKTHLFGRFNRDVSTLVCRIHIRAVIKYVPMVAPKQGRIAAKQVPRPAEQPVEESQIQGAVQDDQGR